MTQPTSEPSQAERAEAVIKAARLDDIYALEPIPGRAAPADGTPQSESWFYGPYVLRINPVGSGLGQEASLLRYLPNGIPHATVIASGDDWIVQRRVDGERLSTLWDSLEPEKQRAAAQQLAAILINLHQTRVSGMPSLSPGWFTAILPADILAMTTRLRNQPGIDNALLDSAARLTRREMVDITPPLRWGFVHRNMTLDHVLWRDDRITALLDFESAVYAPRELELEALLRPLLRPLPHPLSGAGSPVLRGWLQEDYPLLFSEAGLDRRLRLYGIERDLRRLTTHPDDDAALEHLKTVVTGE